MGVRGPKSEIEEQRFGAHGELTNGSIPSRNKKISNLKGRDKQTEIVDNNDS